MNSFCARHQIEMRSLEKNMYQQNMFFLRISCRFWQVSELRFGYLDFCPVHWSDFCGDERWWFIAQFGAWFLFWVWEFLLGMARADIPNICKWAWIYTFQRYRPIYSFTKQGQHFARKLPLPNMIGRNVNFISTLLILPTPSPLNCLSVYAREIRVSLSNVGAVRNWFCLPHGMIFFKVINILLW
jgi:hypothetical protein